jgi:hypothetical protein
MRDNAREIIRELAFDLRGADDSAKAKVNEAINYQQDTVIGRTGAFWRYETRRRKRKRSQIGIPFFADMHPRFALAGVPSPRLAYPQICSWPF